MHVLSPHDAARFAHSVTQEDYEEWILHENIRIHHQRLADEAEYERDAKGRFIEVALKAGAVPEAGVHQYYWDERSGGGSFQSRWHSKKLKVR